MTYGSLSMPYSKLKISSWIQPVSAQAFRPDLQGLLLQEKGNRRRERQTVLGHVIRGDLSHDLPIASRPTLRSRSHEVRNKRSPVESNSIACPGCRLYYRYRCPHCHAPLVPQSKGRRRTTCGHCGSKLKTGIQEWPINKSGKFVTLTGPKPIEV